MKNGIVKVHIENFKKLENVDAALNGQSIFLIGDNEVGKSTFMQAIFSLLANKEMPEKPITNGKEEGKVQVTFIVDGKQYVATRKFTTKNPKGYFEIETEGGMKSNQLSVLAQLVGEISFNPFAFVELCRTADGKRKQAEFVRKLIPKPINEKIIQVDADYAKSYETRTHVGYLVTQSKAQLEAFGEQPDTSIYKDEIKVDAVLAELKEAREHNAKKTELETQLTRQTDAINRYSKTIADLEKQLETAKKEREKVVQNRLVTKAQVDAFKPVDEDALTKQIQHASEHNKRVQAARSFRQLLDSYNSNINRQTTLTSELEDLQRLRKQLIADAKLPVPGLSFDAEGIYLNGLPLDEKQVSTSVIMDLGVRIAVALNPKLKILNIPRGESLGKQRLKEVIDFARNNGYQLFIERVESAVDKLTIQFIE